MKSASELGPLLAKGTIERANGSGVTFVAVFESSGYYQFYWTFTARSARSPRKCWKPLGYHGIYMGKYMSPADMLKYVMVPMKDVGRTRQRFPRGVREFERFFHTIADSYKRPAVIPPGATFERIRRKTARKFGV